MVEDVTAVCISKELLPWRIQHVPFYCDTSDWAPFGREKSLERVEYLAHRRNKAVASALSRYPDTDHILMIDSYYTNQTIEISKLLCEYQGNIVLGASTWVLDKTKVIPRLRFWDNWTTPEATRIKYTNSLHGHMGVKAVGACYVYPRNVWERIHYGVPMDLHGCEHNFLCERSGLAVELSLEAKLWRDPVVYPWGKRLRSSVHLGRFVR